MFLTEWHLSPKTTQRNKFTSLPCTSLPFFVFCFVWQPQSLETHRRGRLSGHKGNCLPRWIWENVSVFDACRDTIPSDPSHPSATKSLHCISSTFSWTCTCIDETSSCLSNANKRTLEAAICTFSQLYRARSSQYETLIKRDTRCKCRLATGHFRPTFERTVHKSIAGMCSLEAFQNWNQGKNVNAEFSFYNVHSVSKEKTKNTFTLQHLDSCL